MIKYPDNIRVYDDFLPYDVAQAIYANLSSIPQQWFSLRKTSNESPTEEPKFSKTWWSIHGDKSERAKLNDKNLMTYQYMATDNHQTGCDCTYCKIIEVFIHNLPPEVSGQTIQESFLSIYRPGDFLSQHHDAGANRTWAFTYTLSTGWRPEWGGILNVHDQESDAWFAFPPKFNRLILMDVTDKYQSRHFVSEVTRDCPINRITFSGWFTDPDDISKAA